MLTPAELDALEERITRNADKLIAKATRTVYNFKDSGTGGQPSSFPNCVQPEMTEVLYGGEDSWPLWVDDIVYGVARLDWYGDREEQRPLSAKKIIQCFALLESIDASKISHLLHVGKRQAQRYYKACELLHQRLIDGYCDNGVHSLHYPEVFIYPRMTDLKEEI